MAIYLLAFEAFGRVAGDTVPCNLNEWTTTLPNPERFVSGWIGQDVGCANLLLLRIVLKIFPSHKCLIAIMIPAYWSPLFTDV